MKIETKYNIGDEVWIIDHNQKVVCTRIDDIHIEYKSYTPFDDEALLIVYIIGGRERREKFVFPTKEELLNSL